MPGLRVLLLGVAAVSCAACGGDGGESRETEKSAEAERAGIVVCDLLSRDEVASILGEAVGEARTQVIGVPGPNRAGIAECSYQSTGGSLKFVSLFLRQSPAPDNDPGGMRETLTTSGAALADETGVGDAAFWDGNALHVFAGRHIYFTVTVAGVKPESVAREHARTLALAAIERLGPVPAL